MATPFPRRSFLAQGAASLAALSTLGRLRLSGAAYAETAAAREWRHYGGDPGAMRYSPLDQINRSNVSKLRPAWVHKVGDTLERPATTIECTPIVIDGILYLTTAQVKTRALKAATGEVLWEFDPFAGTSARRSRGVSRGVTYWQDGDGPQRSKDKRIFTAAMDMLYCLNAETGKLIEGFADHGVLDLKQGLDQDMSELSFSHTTPPAIYRDVLILGGGGGEGPQPAAPGHIRGYDVRTGKRLWIFHTIPRPGELGHDTWEGDSWKTAGGANNWAGMSVDEERGLVFVSTGSPTFDFYGGDRQGANLFGNSVLALKAATGERVWHFQTVHHDVWDYDLPAQPALVSFRQNGRTVDAVAQVTKTGMLFLFERGSGKPIFDIEERPAPKSDVPGEQTWPTQPFPVKPPPFSPHRFTADDITNISPQSHAYVKEIYDKSRAGSIYTPPSLAGTVICPGFLGGALWGGCSFDPVAGRLYVNSSANSNLMTLAPARQEDSFPYRHKGYVRFLDHEKYPAIKPPWGWVTAIDLAKGEFAWREILGELPELTKRGIPKTGTLNVGGTITTAGGLVFVAATQDERIRAFDSKTGETLWEEQLNAGGYATPCTYEANGKQYVVIAAGGAGRGETKAGDEFVAFALL
jgi:quinoprotein glucose dehydrogenase